MNKSIPLIVFSVLSMAVCIAQSLNTGIYITSDDFLSNKITHGGKDTRIKLHEMFNTDIVEVKSNDSTYVYKKNEVYGYINEEGHTFRFFKNTIYKILNPTEKIMIYKTISGMGLKNSPIVTKYFFSKNASTAILPLTLSYIDQEFSDDPFFLALLEIYFKTDEELATYDKIHNQYKINRLLELKQKIRTP